MLVNVAGHIFEIEGRSEVKECLYNFVPFEVNEGEPLFKMKFEGMFSLPQGEKPIVEFDYELSNSEQVKMYIFPSGERTFTIRVGDKVYNMLCSKTGDNGWFFESDIPLEKETRYIIDHFAVQAFSLATMPYQTLLIHASTLTYGKQSVLFLAESGTGKSTHTRLWRENIEGVRMLNDDAPAVRIVEDKAIAFGSPWSGKMPCWRSENYPVRAMVRIRRAQFNKMTKLSRLQAITALVPSCLPTMQRTEDDLDNILGTLSDIIASTDVYTLDCLPNAEAAQVSKGTLFD